MGPKLLSQAAGAEDGIDVGSRWCRCGRSVNPGAALVGVENPLPLAGVRGPVILAGLQITLYKG